jgi:hypothetical protein
MKYTAGTATNLTTFENNRIVHYAADCIITSKTNQNEVAHRMGDEIFNSSLIDLQLSKGGTV